jgi:hypothetical protein
LSFNGIEAQCIRYGLVFVFGYLYEGCGEFDVFFVVLLVSLTYFVYFLGIKMLNLVLDRIRPGGELMLHKKIVLFLNNFIDRL